jgi:hypothetical protein
LEQKLIKKTQLRHFSHFPFNNLHKSLLPSLSLSLNPFLSHIVFPYLLNIFCLSLYFTPSISVTLLFFLRSTQVIFLEIGFIGYYKHFNYPLQKVFYNFFFFLKKLPFHHLKKNTWIFRLLFILKISRKLIKSSHFKSIFLWTMILDLHGSKKKRQCLSVSLFIFPLCLVVSW